jgi:hypothetical protein
MIILMSRQPDRVAGCESKNTDAQTQMEAKMRSSGLVTLCASLGLAGCQVAQGENFFRSPLVVGYTDGSIKANGNTLAEVYDLPIPDWDGTVIQPGQCVAILIHDGRINSPSEKGADLLAARVMRRGVVAEWQLTTTVTERRDPEADSFTETTLMPNTMSFRRLADGNWRSERIPYRDTSIYGPRLYHGGPISVKVALSELDEKEAELTKTTVDKAFEKTKAVLPAVSAKDVIQGALKSGVSVVAKLGTGEIVALGLEAAKLAWDLYSTVHKADDVWLDEAEGWLPAHYFGSDSTKARKVAALTGGRVLKSGIWTLARVSTKTPDYAVTRVQYDPKSPSQLFYRDKGDEGPSASNEPIFLALRFISFAPTSGGKCTP